MGGNLGERSKMVRLHLQARTLGQLEHGYVRVFSQTLSNARHHTCGHLADKEGRGGDLTKDPKWSAYTCRPGRWASWSNAMFALSRKRWAMFGTTRADTLRAKRAGGGNLVERSKTVRLHFQARPVGQLQQGYVYDFS